MKKYNTWTYVMKNKNITAIQDPLIEMDIPKEEFNEIYKEIVLELEGNDDCLESYVDYYFNVNPLKPYTLTFKGEKEKNEFYDIGLKKESVLTLKEIHEGETKNK